MFLSNVSVKLTNGIVGDVYNESGKEIGFVGKDKYYDIYWAIWDLGDYIKNR